ncbi:hypothetical protein [Xanthomonas albilineans]|uniref:hypothetical protein n=1 Tax=Xanthomonas albilineans TaxID=29447 RepID=UPI001269A013|nr:hypothetical protein [Xanthomonas albilineans]
MKSMGCCIILLAFAVSCPTLQASENNGACNAEMAKIAETEAASIKNWSALVDSFSKYKACDDGAIAEGYSESVTNLLVEKWHEFNELISRRKLSAEFIGFVMRHIDDTVPLNRLLEIRKNASKNCPISSRNYCRKIIDAIK